jgi:hypothetical protein
MRACPRVRERARERERERERGREREIILIAATQGSQLSCEGKDKDPEALQACSPLVADTGAHPVRRTGSAAVIEWQYLYNDGTDSAWCVHRFGCIDFRTALLYQMQRRACQGAYEGPDGKIKNERVRLFPAA